MNMRANIPTLVGADLDHAKREAEQGPVFLATDGAVSHVLMTKAEFDRLDAANDPADDSASLPAGRSLTDLLAFKGEGGDFEWEPPKFQGLSSKPFEFD